MIPLARSYDHSNVATLCGSDDSIRWLVRLAVGLLDDVTVVHMKQAEAPKAQQETLNLLKRIVDNLSKLSRAEHAISS